MASWVRSCMRGLQACAAASRGSATTVSSLAGRRVPAALLPRMSRGMCAPAEDGVAGVSGGDTAAAMLADVAQGKVLSESVLRMLSMDNASQEEKNRIKVREAVNKFQRHEHDTGSPEAQIAVFTERIKYLQEHMKVHRKDNSTKRGLMQLVADRKTMLKYLKRKSEERYHVLIQALDIRDVINLNPPKAFLPAKAALAAELKQRQRMQARVNKEAAAGLKKKPNRKK